VKRLAVLLLLASCRERDLPYDVAVDVAKKLFNASVAGIDVCSYVDLHPDKVAVTIGGADCPTQQTGPKVVNALQVSPFVAAVQTPGRAVLVFPDYRIGETRDGVTAKIVAKGLPCRKQLCVDRVKDGETVDLRVAPGTAL
jgi:hypothetical protein